MKTRIILCCFIFLCFVSSDCNRRDFHYDIIIKNNSSSTISISPSFFYPDTTITCPLGHVEILPGDEYFDYKRSGWESILHKPKYFQLFILDPNVINTESCDSIKKYKKYLKRYQLNVDDLNRLNWTITYP